MLSAVTTLPQHHDRTSLARRFLLLRGRLLFARDQLTRTLSRARIGMRPLSAHRQSATMANTAIAAQVHQTLDRLLHLAAQVAFDLVVLVDNLANAHLIVRGQVVGLDR